MDSKRNKNECPICGKVYMLANSLKTHILSHVISNFDCSKCPLTFSKEEQLRKHTTEVHLNNVQDLDISCFKPQEKDPEKLKVYHRVFRCPRCSETFNKKVELQSHTSSHHGDSNSVAVDLIKSNDVANKREVVTKVLCDTTVFGSKELSCKSSFHSHDFGKDALEIPLLVNSEVLSENSDACITLIFKAYHNREEIKKRESHHGKSSGDGLQESQQIIIHSNLNAEGSDNSNITDYICISVNTGVSFIPRTKLHKTDLYEEYLVNEQTVSNSPLLLEKYPMAFTGVDQNEDFIALFKCDNCSMTFFLKEEIECHILTGCNLDSFKEMKCLEEEAETGISIHPFISYDKIFKCTRCPLIFLNKREIESHISSHSDSIEDACLRNGRRNIVLSDIDNSAPECETYDCNNTITIFQSHDCPLCSKFFLDTMELEQHIWSCHNDLDENMLVSMRARCHNSLRTDVSNFDNVDAKSEEKANTILLNGYLTTSHFQNSKEEENYIRKGYTCSVCNKTFFSNKKFLDHKRIHGNRKHACKICGKSFRANSYLQVHMSVHSEARPHICKDCNKSFKSIPGLKKHEVVHLDKRSFECPVCGARFKRKNTLTLHALVHSTNRPYECEICKKTFKNSHTLKGHMVLHKDKNTNEKAHYFCVDCHKTYSSLQNYRTHMRCHKGKFPYKCQYCEKGFAAKSLMTQHLRSHTGERPYNCNICQKKFTLRSTLKNHMDTHSSKKQYMCHICGVHLTYRQALSMHIKMHTGVREHECSVCNKKFYLKCNYNRHMRIHNGERPYPCLMCSKTFKQGSHLKAHMASHGNEKPYQCNVCDKFFVYRSSLQNHMVTHSADKPFVCEKCGKGFKSRGSLKTHVLTHDTEQKFACPDCGKKFKLESSLHIHLKKKSEGSYICQLCKMIFMRRACLYQHKKMHLVEMELNDPVCIDKQGDEIDVTVQESGLGKVKLPEVPHGFEDQDDIKVYIIV
ncbi:zinc finger protein 528-like [Palaemon carinicauda]|uniref:zinc finger protein 528-like n=1 Tax=Palaemon carinicauda TaxID=392227 RepID=UPI0035B6727A